MSLETHLAELERKHQTLEIQLEEALNYPGMSSLELNSLKRRKLQLKDEITRLRTGENALH